MCSGLTVIISEMNIRGKIKSSETVIAVKSCFHENKKTHTMLFLSQCFYLTSLQRCNNCKADTTPPPNCHNIYYKHADTSFLTSKPCYEQTTQTVKKQILNAHSGLLLFFRDTLTFWFLSLKSGSPKTLYMCKPYPCSSLTSGWTDSCWFGKSGLVAEQRCC